MGGDRPRARGRGLRRRAGGARRRVLRDARRRAALRRSRAGAEACARCVGTQWDARIGAAGRRFAALAAASVARAGAAARRPRRGGPQFLAPLPFTLLPLERGATTSSKPSECASSDSLPGFRVAPSPNDWGRTAGAPGAWREAERPRACAAAVRPQSSSEPRSSSPRRSGTSSRFGAPSGARRRRPSRGRSGATASSARSRSAARLVGGRLLAAHADAARAERATPTGSGSRSHRGSPSCRRRCSSSASSSSSSPSPPAASSSCSPPGPRTAAVW